MNREGIDENDELLQSSSNAGGQEFDYSSIIKQLQSGSNPVMISDQQLQNSDYLQFTSNK